MKSLKQVRQHIAKEIGYDEWDTLIEVIKSNTEIITFYTDMVASEYAEQALDEAAEKAQEMNYDLSNRHPDKISLRDFQIVYATPKQEILSIKEQLK